MTSIVYAFGAAESLGPIFARMGGRYTIGAIRMCDSPADQLLCRFPDDGDRKSLTYRGATFSAFQHGAVSYAMGFEFPVSSRKGPRSLDWRVTVAAEPDGTHSLYLTEEGTLLASVRNVPNDNRLCDAIIAMHRSMK